MTFWRSRNESKEDYKEFENWKRERDAQAAEEKRLELEAETKRQSQIDRLRSADCEKLCFGCGNFPLEGWTNIDGGDGNVWNPPPHEDVIKLDVFEALPLIPDGVCSYITSEQFFEHFDRQEGHRMLIEWFRILKPGGVCRIQAPDLEKEVKIYLGVYPDVDWDATVVPHRKRNLKYSKETYGILHEGEEYTRAMLINNGMHMDGHRFHYDFETLSQAMRIVGFTDAKRASFGQSEHEALTGIDHHDGGETGRSWIPGIVLTAEGTKPRDAH